MELVKLENIKDAIVGLPGVTGLSTEQRKRLTIVVELVANPSIIFIDELTSGLDARAAAIVMRAVRNCGYRKNRCLHHSSTYVEIPYVFAQCVYYSLIVYAMVSFEWTATDFFWLFFMNFFSFLYFTYFGMMTVSITPNEQIAAIFAAGFYLLFNIFSGFYIPQP
nr:ABC transporter G family member 35-like [Tanacetum cinerariifolium]